MAMTPEGRVKAATKKKLVANEVWFFCPVSNGMGVAGIPDFVGCRPYIVSPKDVGKKIGLFLAVETKAPGKLDKLTELQKRQIRLIRAAGGVAVAIDAADQLDALFDEGETRVHCYD
jgi:hypothetical protein